MSRPGQGKSLIPLLVYALLGILHVTALGQDWPRLAFYSKPLLMLSLLAWLWPALPFRSHAFSRSMLMALALSLAGDIALEFDTGEPDTAIYFILGLGFFLLAQLGYLAAFRALAKEQHKSFRLRPWLLIAGLLYAAGVNWLIQPALATALQIPVLVYSLVISAMLLTALHLDQALPQQQARLFMIGALFFVCSDTMLAFSSFLPGYLPIACPSCWVMSTYILAQGFLAGAALLYIRQRGSE